MAAVCAALSAVCHTDDARVIFGEHLPFVRRMFLHFNDLDDAAKEKLRSAAGERIKLIF